jgi:hypothetical protein
LRITGEAENQAYGRQSVKVIAIAYQSQAFAVNQGLRLSHSGVLKTKEQPGIRKSWDTLTLQSGRKPQEKVIQRKRVGNEATEKFKL